MPLGLTVTPLWLNPPWLHLLSMACFCTDESPANRVDTRDYRIHDRILLSINLQTETLRRRDVPADVPANVTKKTTFCAL